MKNLITLIVDDDVSIQMLHKVMVGKSNISNQPLIFGNGQLALDYLLEKSISQQQYLVLLDINMPILNGWGFLDAIQRSSFENQLLIVIVTSSVDGRDRAKASNYKQIIGFMEKPLKIDGCNAIKSLPEVASFFN